MSTTYTQIEPLGFGLSPFGEVATDKIEIEFGRGFGDLKTVYVEDNDE